MTAALRSGARSVQVCPACGSHWPTRSECRYAAAFWQTSPAANYKAIARRFVDQLSLNVSDSARLFATLDLTAADALINTWKRPITAIRHPDDGNPATDADASWTPLFSAGFPTSPPLPGPPDPLPIGGVGGPLSTPPYPDHSSGATAYASASMAALASFFGTDNMTFYATSGRFPGEQRTFNRFSDLTDEVLEARIWPGFTSVRPTCRPRTSAARSSGTSTSTNSRSCIRRRAGRPTEAWLKPWAGGSRPKPIRDPVMKPYSIDLCRSRRGLHFRASTFEPSTCRGCSIRRLSAR